MGAGALGDAALGRAGPTPVSQELPSMEPAGSAEPELLLRDEGPVRVLTLNRPERVNALNASLKAQLVEALFAAEDDPTVRVIVLTATGPTFCGGIDLKDRAADDARGEGMRAPTRGPLKYHSEVMLETWKPTIAAVEGAAVGAGLELVLACDMRVIGESATFVFPEVKRGTGGQFPITILPRVAGTALAFEMLYTGDPIGADRALAAGLVNRVVPDGSALTAALELAGRIAANAPVSLRRIKETMVRANGLPLAVALRLNEGMSPYDSEDRREGIRSFVEKRPPVWRGK
jgi:enoyl-CoA hydratase